MKPFLFLLRCCGVFRVWSCERAASRGHLGWLRHAHKAGAPWNESTCDAAAENGHLDCLRYAHENGAPLGDYLALPTRAHSAGS
jgi:hypothetical protein